MFCLLRIGVPRTRVWPVFPVIPTAQWIASLVDRCIHARDVRTAVTHAPKRRPGDTELVVKKNVLGESISTRRVEYVPDEPQRLQNRHEIEFSSEQRKDCLPPKPTIDLGASNIVRALGSRWPYRLQARRACLGLHPWPGSSGPKVGHAVKSTGQSV